jgi:hypothetical protein
MAKIASAPFASASFHHALGHFLATGDQVLRHAFELATGQGLEPGPDLGPDVAAAHGRSENLAQDLRDLTARQVVYCRDQHQDLLLSVDEANVANGQVAKGLARVGPEQAAEVHRSRDGSTRGRRSCRDQGNMQVTVSCESPRLG